MTLDVPNGEAKVDGDCQMGARRARGQRFSSTSAIREAPSPATCRAGICLEDFEAHKGEIHAVCYARVTRNMRTS